MRKAYRRGRMTAQRLELLAICSNIIDEYQKQGIKVTLRQLYYQMVARDIIPNTVKSYGKIKSIITDGRYKGYVDWDAIVDRTRWPSKHSEFIDIPNMVDYSIKYLYRTDWWMGQSNYVEVWCEKDALASVLSPVTRELHTTLLVNRGYSSASTMRQSALRIVGKHNNGYKCHILYLGDHDPSGLDMIRDVQDRLDEITQLHNHRSDVRFHKNAVTVEHLALTMNQVRELNPPPNPAKITDPRAGQYLAGHGPVSWEVDAMPPNIMMDTVREAIKEYIDDPDDFERIKHIDDENKDKLRDIMDEHWKEEEEE